MSETNGDDYRLISLDRIRPSPTNPRQRFDEQKLEELAASIREKGLLQPVLVRPLRGRLERHPGLNADVLVTDTGLRFPGLVDLRESDSLEKQLEAGEWYELIAGERRVRAARLAGLAEVRAVVSALSDRAVLEVQLIENEQREDVLPSEKAAGYQGKKEWSGSKKPSRPAAVKPVALNGKLYVVTGADHTTTGDSWDLRSLHPVAEFERDYLTIPTRFAPGTEGGRDYYAGVVLRVGKAEYAIGPKQEQRRLVQLKEAWA